MSYFAEILMNRRKVKKVIKVAPELLGRNVMLDGSKKICHLGDLGLGTVVSFNRLVTSRP